MNKEDILQSHRQESHREYIQFLDSKTVPPYSFDFSLSV